MELIPEWTPNIHPMVVHFPIAILGIAIFFDFVSFFLSRKKKWWTEEATAFLYGVGALAAVIVYYTGTLAADSVSLPAQAQPILSNHASWAWWTIWFYGIYAIARIAATWWTSEKHRLKFHVGFFLLSLVGMFFLFETGEHGAEMVFKHGVGVKAADIENPVQHDHETDHGQGEDTHSEGEAGHSHEEGTERSFNAMNNGSWTWNISHDAPEVLADRFTFLQGSVQALNASVTESHEGDMLELRPAKTFFVSSQSYGDMQLDFNLNAADYSGSVMLTHHVQDAQNYDYMAVNSDGSAELGRVRNGRKNVIEEADANLQNANSLRVVSAGDHIRGYMNGELVLHGHTEAAAEGKAGVKTDGSGKLSVMQLKLTKIGEEAQEHEHAEGEEHHH